MRHGANQATLVIPGKMSLHCQCTAHKLSLCVTLQEPEGSFARRVYPELAECYAEINAFAFCCNGKRDSTFGHHLCSD